MSEADKAAISNVNGHSSATTKKYYIQQDMAGDVNRSRTAFNEAWTGTEEIDQAQEVWGTEHPCKGKTGSRIKWSDAELDYLSNTIDWCLSVDPDSKTLMASCLKIIKERDNYKTRPIFHDRHVLKSDRLRAGYDTLKRLGMQPTR
jgi:hypothetical protein